MAASARRTKADLLGGGHIDQANWRDTGCEVAPACLACPLAACKYDVPRFHVAQRMAAQIAHLAALRAAGANITAMESATGYSRRKIFRLLALARKEKAHV